MSQLFRDPGMPEKQELPEGIIEVELSNLEAAALKLFVFVDIPNSKTELKRIATSILTSMPAYFGVKGTQINKAVDGLATKGMITNFDNGWLVPYNIAMKIHPLAKDNLPLIKSAITYFSRSYRGRSSDYCLHLSILVNDFGLFDEIVRVSRAYGWYDVTDEIKKALLKLGDLTLIIPMLPNFHESSRNQLFNKLPFALHYEYFKQLKDIFLTDTVEVSLYSKYLYASCANLLLPADEVIEITKALGINQECLFFTKLLQGDIKTALLQASSFLIDIQEEEGHRRKELPGIFGLLYGIVLLSAGGAKQLALAATFVRSSIKQMPQFTDHSNPFLSFAEIVLLFINHKLGKKITSADEIFRGYEQLFHGHFLAVVLKWLGKPLIIRCPPLLSEKEEFEYRAACIINSEDTPGYNESRLEELRTQFKITPLAEVFKPEEIWEDVLSLLASEVTSKKNSVQKDTAPKKRLVWLVDPLVNSHLKCLEQVHNKSGWTKGKERSLVRLLSVLPDFSTLEDRAVIACIHKGGYYNDLYIPDWNNLLSVLAKHAEVYTYSAPHLPLKIRIQEAQVQIDKQKDGATIKLKPKSPEPRVVKETPTSYIYTNWSKKALQLYHVLTEANLKVVKIPQSGMQKAKPVFERLTDVMHVAGSLVEPQGERRKSDNIPVLQLTPVEQQLHVQLLIEVLKGESALFVPGIGSAEVVVKDSKNKYFNIERERAVEKDILFELAERITWLQEMKSTSAQLFLDNDEDILDFLAEVKELAPEVKIIWPKGERLRVAKVLSHKNINVSIKQAQNWFAVEGDIVIDENLKLSMQQLLEKSKGGSLKYIQLDDKTYLSICVDLRKRLAALATVAHSKGKKIVVHELGSGSIEKFVEGIEQVTSDKKWKQHLNKLVQLKAYRPSLPDNLQAELRPYQEEGVLWLDRLHYWGVGACLADDMGLGKTIQAISILLKYAKNGPSLVLAPSSVCKNWVKELIRFAPTLNPVELKTQNREAALGKLHEHDVLILSYGLLQSNPELLTKLDWNIVVLDEAHAIKNAKSIRSKAVMKLNAKFRIITTGTPLQNHLGELWNLLQFINPGMLGSSEQFTKKFVQSGNAVDDKQMRKNLSRYISPFILRRNKSEVLDDLPEKTEVTLQVTLSPEERAMYEALREKAIEKIASSDSKEGGKHLQILAEITKLRQMSCHPKMVMPDSDLSSSKLEALENLVDDLIGAKHKALVFSQFTKHLALIRKMLDKKGVSYQYLDGSTPIKKRELAIDNFQSGKSDLFLISLKAGGVGLNLTAADYVIHMDPWWNPAVEDQASDRAHRIGQQRPVTIYRIIAENTIEEKIVKMHHSKRDLADKLLANTDQSAKISTEELLELITENQ